SGRPRLSLGARRSRPSAVRIELLAAQPELLVCRWRSRSEPRVHLRLPANAGADLLERGAGMERVEAHLARLVEVPDPEIGHNDRRPAAQPPLLAPDPGAVGAAEIAGTRPEVDPIDEAAPGLAHDHEHLTRIDRD